MRVLCSALMVVTVTALSSSSALAATYVSRSGNTVTITGGDEVNYVDQISYGDSGPLRYKDPAGMTYDTGSCTDVGDNTVECGTLAPGLVANVSLGGGDDTFRPESTMSTSPRLVVDMGAGNDTMWGSANNDSVQGGDGDDVINGRGGNDTLDGGPGNDQVSGAGGDDTVTGGPGRDSLFGDGEFSGFSWGNDTLQARDGEIDALSCSFGADTAVADAADTFDVLGDCEARDISAAPGNGDGGAPGTGGGNPSGGGGTTLAAAIGKPAAVKLRSLLSGKALKFTVTFTGACKAAAGLVVRASEAKRLKIGKADTLIARDTATVPQAGTYAARLKISKRYRTKLKRARKLTAYIGVVCTDAAGGRAQAARKVVLRR